MSNQNNDPTHSSSFFTAFSDEKKQRLEQLLAKWDIISEIVEEREKDNEALNLFKKKEMKLDQQFKIS